MLPYRRRQFEATAMLNEMLQRCHIIEDLSEPHPTTAAQCHIQRSLSMPEGDEHHMVIVPPPLNRSLCLPTHLTFVRSRYSGACRSSHSPLIKRLLCRRRYLDFTAAVLLVGCRLRWKVVVTLCAFLIQPAQTLQPSPRRLTVPEQ